MCNDYERHVEWEAYTRALATAQLGISVGLSPEQLKPADDTRVGDTAPIIRAAGNGVELAPMRWGFTPARPGGPPVFNFKSEGRDFSKSKRCLIPASAFFEFTGKQSPKTKWRFALPGEPVFAVAGLWREDQQGAAFTMLTTSPGPDVAPFHDRQIVVVPPQRWGEWLYLHQQESTLLAPLPPGSLQVSMARKGREDPPDCLVELAQPLA
jgi:putative SOS response-associated peptidase YedK